MIIVLTTLMLVPQIQATPPLAGGGRQIGGIASETSLLAEAAVPLTPEQLVFHFEAVRAARLARLDQLLALTGKQRAKLSAMLSKVENKHNDLLHIGAVLKPKELRSMLSARQRTSMDMWAKGASDRRVPTNPRDQLTIKHDYHSAGALLVDRLCQDLHCSDKQERRLALAIRGGWKRYLAKHQSTYIAVLRLRTESAAFTAGDLVQQRMLVPLIAEMEIWQKAVKRTLTAEQFEKYQQIESARSQLYHWANAAAMTGILQIDHSLTTSQAQQLASLVESRFDAKSRLAFPILESSHPLFVLTERELQTILPFDVANVIYSQLKSVKKSFKPVEAQEDAREAFAG